MSREVFQLVTDSQLAKEEMRQRIKWGQLTNEMYSSMPPKEQQLVHEVLLDNYRQNVDVHAALSALEFGAIFLAKLLFKQVDLAKLTASETEFFNQFRVLVEGHDASLSLDWYFSYFANVLNKTQENRQEYRLKKQEITTKI